MMEFNLNPAFTVLGHEVVLDTAALGAVPVSELNKAVNSLRDSRASIQEAIDTLFGGC